MTEDTNISPTGTSSEFDIESFLKIAVIQGVSDIHIRVGSPPLVRKDGLMMKSKLAPLTQENIKNIIEKIIPDHIKNRVYSALDMDYSIEIENIARFRVNILRDLGNIGLVFRVIPVNIPTIEELYLPDIIKHFTTYNNGLVLVTGPTGSGKSTTLAAMLDYLNQSTQKHIISLEDPIEFIHRNKKSVFTQRQLGVDTDTFVNGLKYALRQDPDVILIGEMRDRETISSALKAAETGHLVFSTLHTTDAVQTINRIINAFEPFEREAVRVQIASTLRGTVSQKLIKRCDGKGRVPAAEIMAVTPGIRDYILRDEINKIYEVMKSTDYAGTMSMNIALYRLVKANLIDTESAISASDSPNEMEQILKGSFHGSIASRL